MDWNEIDIQLEFKNGWNYIEIESEWDWNAQNFNGLRLKLIGTVIELKCFKFFTWNGLIARNWLEITWNIE